MQKHRVRLVTYAWGKAYVDKLLDYTIASVLSPGNLPALAKAFDCEVVIVTEENLFPYLDMHAAVTRLRAVCPVRFIPLDDLVGEPWQYGMTLAYALFRGMADLGPAMTETFFLFLNGDFILADGSYERLIPHIARGERAVLSPSYCANGERVAPLLDLERDKAHGFLSLAPRMLAKLILENRHNTVRAKTVNQQLVHFKYMDQFYWEVDKDTLVGFQMPVSLIGMRPEVALADISAFWDWGVVYDFCPSRRLTVLGDSDEFLMLELRSAQEHSDLIIFGGNPPEEIASRMLGFITQYQVDNAQLPLTLHSGDLPANVDESRRSLQEYRDRLIRCLPAAPIDHRGHQQWAYHKGHFAELAKNRGRHLEIARLRSDIGRLEAAHQNEVQRIRQLYEPPIAEMRRRLHEMIAPVVPGPAATVAIEPPVSTQLSAHHPRAAPRPRSIKRVAAWLVGRMPDPRPWHPLYLPYRPICRALRQAIEGGSRLILVGEPQSVLARSRAGLPRDWLHLTPMEVLARRSRDTEPDRERFGAAVVELSSEQLQDFAEILDVLRTHVDGDGTIVVHVLNPSLRSPHDWASVLAMPLLGTDVGVQVSTSGSWAGAVTTRMMSKAWRVSSHSLRGRAHWAFYMAGSIVTALLALIQEGRTAGGDATRSMRKHCTSLTLTIRSVKRPEPVLRSKRAATRATVMA